jgi:hypothetical protein
LTKRYAVAHAARSGGRAERPTTRKRNAQDIPRAEEASAGTRAEEKQTSDSLLRETQEKLHQALSDLARARYEANVAVRAERERCLSIVEQFAKTGDYRGLSRVIAAAIRKGPA